MTRVVCQALSPLGPDLTQTSYVDDTVLVGPAPLLEEALDALPAALAPAGLHLRPDKTRIWAPRVENVEGSPAFRRLRDGQADPRGLHILGEAVGEDPVDAYPIGDAAEHIRQVQDRVTDDLHRFQHFPQKLPTGVGGIQVGLAFLQQNVPPRFLHILRAYKVELISPLCETVGDKVRQVLLHWLPLLCASLPSQLPAVVSVRPI